jgi:PKD repeat protein
LQNPSHTYTFGGYFYPSLTATNNLAGAVLSSLPLITALPPYVQFTANTNIGGVPLIVQFTCPNIDSAGNAITNWSWTFGDGFTSTAQNPSHTYSTAGTFYPSLVVINSNATQIFASGPPVVTAVAYLGLVLNGGFENGNFFGWTLADSGLYGYDLVDTFNQSTEDIQPHTGSYFARLGQSGSLGYLSQTLGTTPGAKYLLSFWLNNPDGLTPNQFLVSWNGTTIFSRTNFSATGNSPAAAWTNLQFVVTATATNTVLQFGFRDDPAAFGLDDISVVQVTPALTLQPQNKTVTCHSNATFTVAASGPPPLSYQWQRNGAPLLGATNTAYSVTPLTCQGPDSYSVVITNFSGSITSDVVTLTVLDTTPPVIVCPTNLLVNTDPGQCSAVVNYSVTATDNCAVVSLTFNLPPGSVFPKGTNVVLCTATDCAGNTNTCSFTVTVLDREAPVVICPPDQVVPCTSTNGAQVFFTTIANDNCDTNLTVTSIPASGSYFTLGTNAVTCVSTDTSGNSNSCTFTITVVEPAPVLKVALDGTNVMLSWPQSCALYVVEQKTELNAGSDWSPVNTPPAPVADRFIIAVPLSGENQFFRLKRN